MSISDAQLWLYSLSHSFAPQAHEKEGNVHSRKNERKHPTNGGEQQTPKPERLLRSAFRGSTTKHWLGTARHSRSGRSTGPALVLPRLPILQEKAPNTPLDLARTYYKIGCVLSVQDNVDASLVSYSKALSTKRRHGTALHLPRRTTLDLPHNEATVSFATPTRPTGAKGNVAGICAMLRGGRLVLGRAGMLGLRRRSDTTATGTAASRCTTSGTCTLC